MSMYSPSIEKLIQSFEKLPSIGNKTAARLAFYMLNASEEETNEFVSSIINAKKNLKYCSKCYNISDTDPCPICGNPKRGIRELGLKNTPDSGKIRKNRKRYGETEYADGANCGRADLRNVSVYAGGLCSYKDGKADGAGKQGPGGNSHCADFACVDY